MTPDNAVFVDTNVWIYAGVDTAPRFEEAQSWLKRMFDSGLTLYISPQILREYMVVLTRGRVLGRQIPFDTVMNQAVEMCEVAFVLEENLTVASRLRKLIKTHQVKGKQIHDANIAATMLTNRISQLATYNPGDFKRYQAITCLTPPGADS